jgi:hypothetical protein
MAAKITEIGIALQQKAAAATQASAKSLKKI